MPIGTWVIDNTPPSGAVKLCDEYLPAGATLKFQIDGPTRLAIEEQRRNELGGSLILLPQISPVLCMTGIGEESEFGNNLCKNSKLTTAPDHSFVFENTVFIFDKLTTTDISKPENLFFTDLGARKNANFATIFIQYKSVAWRLWLRSSDQMISECLAQLPGKNNFTSFPMYWSKQNED